ncbi:hypothetical protein BDZ89DRAFT_1072485 [Hymenopellis radicata]|nr:hypothetical protein BDZ89DRAFT_1072485 [Hymenopellis radicata]
MKGWWSESSSFLGSLAPQDNGGFRTLILPRKSTSIYGQPRWHDGGGGGGGGGGENYTPK